MTVADLAPENLIPINGRKTSSRGIRSPGSCPNKSPGADGLLLMIWPTLRLMVRERGLEPPPLTGPDPKSGASAISPLAQTPKPKLPEGPLRASDDASSRSSGVHLPNTPLRLRKLSSATATKMIPLVTIGYKYGSAFIMTNPFSIV